jgi:hypothetical protein
MSSEEEREHFVTHLLIAHSLSRFLIARLQEHGEQIHPQEEIAVVVLVIALQDVLDAIRVKDEVTGPEEQACAHDVPIALGLLRKETEGIMLKSQCTSQQQVPAWSRRSRAVP